MAWTDIFWRPVRGVGRILTGSFKKGLNDIADPVADYAPAVGFIPGINPLAAGAIGLGAGLVDELTDKKKGVDIGRPVGAGIGGYGGGKLAKHVGGVSGLVNAGREGGPTGVARVLLGGKDATAPSALQNAAEDQANRTVKSWMTPTNAAMLAQGAGAAANAYGAHQMGKAEDRRIRFEESLIKRRQEREEAMDPLRAELLKMLFGRLQHRPGMGARRA